MSLQVHRTPFNSPPDLFLVASIQWCTVVATALSRASPQPEASVLWRERPVRSKHTFASPAAAELAVAEACFGVVQSWLLEPSDGHGWSKEWKVACGGCFAPRATQCLPPACVTMHTPAKTKCCMLSVGAGVGLHQNLKQLCLPTTAAPLLLLQYCSMLFLETCMDYGTDLSNTLKFNTLLPPSPSRDP
ncbi:hypothetical protein HRR88_005757 [Exophiala dermatitidis]|nr:hypothetical protein HRR74_004413 [Exophiala dermatitidis]KAJ4521016.1 hypothetical protein HRR73_003357 [Exophiala dermatitidis]KAJ4547599.1 hypothetical protein HRR76_000231 [Exophiala dermatitidis]KAJ4553538.1 hypothetical protein HRR77_001922 [Exophiala dermatitidis]KAJ4563409.1 hypothetical protein HRR79_006290 [Exophiala dermatitidis]